MSDCAECGYSLVGEMPVSYEDGPLDPGDRIPRSGRLYEEEVGYIVCPGCGSERPVRPKDWYEIPEEL